MSSTYSLDASINGILSVPTISGSVNFTGTATAVTQATSDSSTKVATTAFVKNQGYSVTNSNAQFNTVYLTGNRGQSVVYAHGSNFAAIYDNGRYIAQSNQEQYLNVLINNGWRQYGRQDQYGNGNPYQAGGMYISLLAEGALFTKNSIGCGQVESYSDERIKENIKDVDLNEDIFENIKIKVYEYKDKTFNLGIGVIAQDIFKVLPSCINITKSTIPNINKGLLYKLFEDDDILHLYIDENNCVDAIIDDILEFKNNSNQSKYGKVIYKDEKVIHLKLSEKLFENQLDSDKIFVYGKIVDDFMTVKYDQLFSLNICQTQKNMRKIKIMNATILSLEAAIKNQTRINFGFLIVLLFIIGFTNCNSIMLFVR